MQKGTRHIKEKLWSRRVTAWLLAFFVSAQIVATAHAGSYGAKDHLHDGHPCIVASIAKKSADYDLPPLLTFEDRPSHQGDYIDAHYDVAQAEYISHSLARAPPTI